MKTIAIAIAAILVSGCATLTESPMTPITLSFSNGESGKCTLTNKRAAEFQNKVRVPSTVMVRKSDDDLIYRCETESGEKVAGAIPSRMGGKIVASAVFLDFGIVDSITDQHREYPHVFIIPVGVDAQSNSTSVLQTDAAHSAFQGDHNEVFDAPKRTVSWTSVEYIDRNEFSPFLSLRSSKGRESRFGWFSLSLDPCYDAIWPNHWSKGGRKVFPGVGDTAWVSVDFGDWRPVSVQGPTIKKKSHNGTHGWITLNNAIEGSIADHQYIHIGMRLDGKDVVLPFSLTNAYAHLHKFECD